LFNVFEHFFGGLECLWWAETRNTQPRMGHALPLVSLCKALAQRGHQVTLAASSGSPAAVGWLLWQPGFWTPLF